MGSPQKMDYGGRSTFSWTCSLLSQYYAENGGFGQLNLGLVSSGAAAAGGTLDLLSKIEKFDQASPPSCGEESLPEGERRQLTIFYGGEAIVFDDFPAEKAHELMMFAANVSAPGASTPVDSASSSPHLLPAYANTERRHPTDILTARKRSMARFLEKRKERISIKAGENKAVTGAGSSSPASLTLQLF